MFVSFCNVFSFSTMTQSYALFYIHYNHQCYIDFVLNPSSTTPTQTSNNKRIYYDITTRIKVFIRPSFPWHSKEFKKSSFSTLLYFFLTSNAIYFTYSSLLHNLFHSELPCRIYSRGIKYYEYFLVFMYVYMWQEMVLRYWMVAINIFCWLCYKIVERFVKIIYFII